MKRKTTLLANLSQSASHSSMLWLVKMIEVPDLRVEQGFTAAQPEDKNIIEIRENSVSTGNQPPDGIDGLPHLPPGGRVHPCRRLVQQHHLWPVEN